MASQNKSNHKGKRKTISEIRQKPEISVIMPAYNAEKTIAGAINSILSQTYKNWELIIVNDGSTDQTERIIRNFRDSRIRYFYQEHSEIVASRNYGNELSRAEWCIIQDSDDFSMPDRLEKVVRCFKEKNPDVIVHGIYVNGWNNEYQCINRTYSPPVLDAKNNKINGVVAFKKHVWKSKPYRKETQYAYDYMMNLDWMLSGFKYFALDEGLYEYIRYNNSASDRFERSGLKSESINKIKEIILKDYGKTVGINIK